jgi:hypothetical protein
MNKTYMFVSRAGVGKEVETTSYPILVLGVSISVII